MQEPTHKNQLIQNIASGVIISLLGMLVHLGNGFSDRLRDIEVQQAVLISRMQTSTEFRVETNAKIAKIWEVLNTQQKAIDILQGAK